MEPTGSECLGRAETILRSATEITNGIDGSLGKTLLRKDLKGQVKRMYTSPEKCLKIQTKDSKQLFGNNICHRTRKKN